MDMESFVVLYLQNKMSCNSKQWTEVHIREGHCKLKAINEESIIKLPDYWPEISQTEGYCPPLMPLCYIGRVGNWDVNYV